MQSLYRVRQWKWSTVVLEQKDPNSKIDRRQRSSRRPNRGRNASKVKSSKSMLADCTCVGVTRRPGVYKGLVQWLRYTVKCLVASHHHLMSKSATRSLSWGKAWSGVVVFPRARRNQHAPSEVTSRCPPPVSPAAKLETTCSFNVGMLEMNATLTAYVWGRWGGSTRGQEPAQMQEWGRRRKSPQCLHWEARHGRERSTHFSLPGAQGRQFEDRDKRCQRNG